MKDDCVFCKIVSKEIRAGIVYEDEYTVAFDDINPQAPVHVLVLPKEHIENLMSVKDYGILGYIFETIKRVAEIKKIDKDGFRVVVNYLKKGGQTVFHLHFHVIGGRQMLWPPG